MQSSVFISEGGSLESLGHVDRKKHLQKMKIVRHLYIKGAKSNADLGHYLNISSPTSIGLINELMAEGLVERRGRGVSVGGRKPELYGLCDNSMFVLSVDIGRFKTRMAIFDNNHNNISGVHSFPIQVTKDVSAVDELYEGASSLLLQSGIDTARLVGVGISMPGLVSTKEGKNYTYLLCNKDGDSLQQVLENKFLKPVYIQNDTKTSTLGEYRFGLAYGRKDVLVLNIDWGVGLGIIMDGKLRNGSSGFAGEFGHIPIEEEGRLCSCGKRGCLETVASGIALSRLAKEGLARGHNSILRIVIDKEAEEIEPRLIIDAANSGDQFAISLLAEIGRNLGKGIAALVQLFNPELVILGGRMAEASEYITIPIQQSLQIYSMTQLRERTMIALSELGSSAGILGAVALVMENLFLDQLELA